jgi:anaerobic selenocysteine-containing dehydrogenase
VSELAGWSDYDLEAQGRLAEPVSYDAPSDTYKPISWEEAFRLVGSTLRGLGSPHQASFCTSGRLSNEATFLYQLWVREFGTNNLPDCSNMCHEASGRGMTAAIGSGKGTVDLNDWEQADAIFLMGDNAASNAPRMLTWLAEAERRGAQLVHINPLIEAASRRTIVPHEMVDMATFRATKIGTMNAQVRIGGDFALMRGVAKAVFEAAASDPKVIDNEFIEEYTHGFEEYRALCQATAWADLVRDSGMTEQSIRRARRGVSGIRTRDHRVVPGRHAARARRRHRS